MRFLSLTVPASLKLPLLIGLFPCLSQADIISGGLSWLPVDQSTNWSFTDVLQEFNSAGQFDGYRHATLTEVWSLVESFGYSELATPEENAIAVTELQSAIGATYASSAGQFNSWTLGFTEDGTRFDLRMILPDIGDPDTYQGYAYETDYPFFDVATPQIGHYLVTAVPEPATIALLIGMLALAASFFRRTPR